MAEWMVIANPVAGKGRGREVGEAVFRQLSERGMKVVLAFTGGQGDGQHRALEGLAGGVRRFVVCGGDGTVNEVVEALATSDAVLGIVPCGRGNDLARALEIPVDVAGAVDVLVRGWQRRIDLGRIGGRHFATVACLGLDSAVARMVYENTAPFSWTEGYVCAIVKGVMTYRSPTVRLEGDFGCFEGPILLVATGSTGFYGGGMKILPSAVCDDGILDVCIIGKLGRLRALRLFPRVFSGGHAALPSVRMERTRSLSIASPEPLWIFADGEPICQTPATIEVAELALTVVCPESGSFPRIH